MKGPRGRRSRERRHRTERVHASVRLATFGACIALSGSFDQAGAITGTASALPLWPIVEGDPAPRKDIESLVRDIIVEQLGTPAERVTLKARLIEDLGADSLDLVELTMALEEKFEIEIKDSDCGKLLTVGDIVEYVRTHRKRP